MKFSTLKLIDELFDEAISFARDEYRKADKLFSEAFDACAEDREDKRRAVSEARAAFDRISNARQDFKSHDFS